MWVGGSSLAGAWSPCRAWTGARVWQPHFSLHQPPPLSYCGSPSAPEAPRCPPGMARAVARRVNQVRAGGERRSPSLGAGKSSFRFPSEVPTPPWLLWGAGGPPHPACEGQGKQPRFRGGEPLSQLPEQEGTEPALQPPPPTPTPTHPDPGSGPSGFSKLLGQPGAAAVPSSSRRSCP